MLKLFRFLKPYIPAIVAVFFLTFFQAISELYLPTLMSDIVDNGIVNGDTDYIITVGIRMLVIALLGMVCAVFSSLLSSRTSSGFGKLLRGKVFSRVESFSLQEFERFGTASLITRTTNDITQLQHVVMMMMRMMLRAPMMCIGGIIMAVYKDPVLSLGIFLAIPLLAMVIILVVRKGMPLFKALQLKLDRLNLVLRERLTGIRVIRAFNRTDYEKRRFNETNRDLTETAVRVNKIMALLMPVMSLILNYTIIAIIWFGSIRIDHGHMQVGDLMAFIQYVGLILFSMMMLSMIFVIIPRASVSAARINEVLETECSIKDPLDTERSGAAGAFAGAGTAAHISTHTDHADIIETGDRAGTTAQASEGMGSGVQSMSASSASGQGTPAVGAGAAPDKPGFVWFDNVTFCYPGAEKAAVSGVSFCAKPGEVTAIIGGTGSGKSTLLKLMLRFYDVGSGRILIDNQDIREMPIQALRAKIGYVPQKSVLFTGTIAENLRYGKEDASAEELQRALELAQAEEFVSQMADGIDSFIEQGGINVSGGQKQRLSIARALIRKPEIYLFDDRFSALDFKTDTRLRKALKKETANSTMIIVAQRVSTVIDADQIVVLDEGKIVGTGRHRELLEKCRVYREIVSSQLSLEELA